MLFDKEFLNIVNKRFSPKEVQITRFGEQAIDGYRFDLQNGYVVFVDFGSYSNSDNFSIYIPRKKKDIAALPEDYFISNTNTAGLRAWPINKASVGASNTHNLTPEQVLEIISTINDL